MRELKEIRKEAEQECVRDGCQSWPSICLVAMEKALKEYQYEQEDKELNRIESEKPGEDIIIMIAEEINGGCISENIIPYGKFVPLARRIEQFAERYHQSRMGEK